MGLISEIVTPGRIVFGPGARHELAALLRESGAQRVLLVTGRDQTRAASVQSNIEAGGAAVATFAVASEPTLQMAREGVDAALAERAELVVACGGGSALDAAKALAILATNGGEPIDFLEVIGRGQSLKAPSIPVIALPTTAGTGSEVSRNAVLCSPEVRAKASLRSPLMLPKVALVDPELLADLPKPVLAAGGLDALSHLIEPFLSVRAQPLTDAWAREGMRRSARSLRRAYTQGLDASAREDLAVASLCGGLCLANAGLGAVHGFAAPLGGSFSAPHGAVCAVLLPLVLEVNARALAARAGDNPVNAKLGELASLLTGRAAPAVPSAAATSQSVHAVVHWLEELVNDLQIPALRSYGMSAGDIPDLVAKAKMASSMRANPLPLADDELTEILTRAL